MLCHTFINIKYQNGNALIKSGPKVQLSIRDVKIFKILNRLKTFKFGLAIFWHILTKWLLNYALHIDTVLQ